MPTDTDALYFVASADFHTGHIPAERLTAVFTAGAAAAADGARFFAAVGDITDAGAAEQYDTLQGQVMRLGVPFCPVMGNHEHHTAPCDEARALFCRTFGLDAPSYIRTVDGVPFVFLSADRSINGCRVGISDALPVLRAALADGDGPLFVLCHAPLIGTVGAAPGRPCFVSNDPEFGVVETHEVRALLAAAHRPVVWISGHTHPPLNAEKLFATEAYGTHPLHSVSLMCPFYTSRDGGTDDPVPVYHFRVRKDAVEVEIRDVFTGQAVRTESLPLA